VEPEPLTVPEPEVPTEPETLESVLEADDEDEVPGV
jgi:hypothetical protein